MKFVLRQTSNYKRREAIEINSLDELMELAKREGAELVLTPPGLARISSDSTEWEVEIYDDYRE